MGDVWSMFSENHYKILCPPWKIQPAMQLQPHGRSQRKALRAPDLCPGADSEPFPPRVETSPCFLLNSPRCPAHSASAFQTHPECAPHPVQAATCCLEYSSRFPPGQSPGEAAADQDLVQRPVRSSLSSQACLWTQTGPALYPAPSPPNPLPCPASSHKGPSCLPHQQAHCSGHSAPAQISTWSASKVSPSQHCLLDPLPKVTNSPPSPQTHPNPLTSCVSLQRTSYIVFALCQCVHSAWAVGHLSSPPEHDDLALLLSAVDTAPRVGSAYEGVCRVDSGLVLAPGPGLPPCTHPKVPSSTWTLKWL